MYVQGVSTRKVRAITEELCGHGFSASTVSSITVQLDEELERFMTRPLTEEFAYVMLDARYERVRETGVIRSRAVLVAIGIDWDGQRQVLGVALAGRESLTAWRDFLIGLKQRVLETLAAQPRAPRAGLGSGDRGLIRGWGGVLRHRSGGGGGRNGSAHGQLGRSG